MGSEMCIRDSVAVEGCALRSYGDEDLDAALALVCDGALGGDHAARAPVIARDVIAAVAAGGQAQNEKRSQQGRDKAKLFQEMHPFGPVRPCLSQKVIRNTKTTPGQAQENFGVEPAQCC